MHPPAAFVLAIAIVALAVLLARIIEHFALEEIRHQDRLMYDKGYEPILLEGGYVQWRRQIGMHRRPEHDDDER